MTFVYLILLSILSYWLLRDFIKKKKIYAFQMSVVGICVFMLFDGIRADINGLKFGVSDEYLFHVHCSQLYFIFTFIAFYQVFRKLRFAENHSSSNNIDLAIKVDAKKMFMWMLFSLSVLVASKGLAIGGYGFLLSYVAKGFFLGVLCYAIINKQILSMWGLCSLFVVMYSFLLDDDLTSRRGVIVPVLVVISVYLLKDYVWKRFSYNRVKLFPIFLFSIAGFLYLNYMRSSHDFGYGYIEGEQLSNTLNYILTMRSIDAFSNTVFIFDFYSSGDRLKLGSTYLFLFTSMIPRAVWAEKPLTFAAELGFNLRTGLHDVNFAEWVDINQFSLSPSLLGEMYANFSWIGIIFAPFLLAYVASRFDSKLFNSPSRIYIVPFTAFFLLVFRGDFYAAIQFPLLISIGMYWSYRTYEKCKLKKAYGLGVIKKKS